MSTLNHTKQPGRIASATRQSPASGGVRAAVSRAARRARDYRVCRSLLEIMLGASAVSGAACVDVPVSDMIVSALPSLRWARYIAGRSADSSM